MSEDPARRRLSTDTDNGIVVIFSGPSGVGKTTIARAVERSFPDAVFSVSATTRPPRSTDVDGIDYRFLDPDDFQRRVDAGDFLEHAEYAGNRYGTLREPTEEQLRRGRLIILDIDVQGAAQVKATMPDALAVFILPPSEDELLRRLCDRRSEDEATIRRRFEEATREIAAARMPGIYDHFIVNETLDRAIDQAVELVTNRRQRP